MHVSKARPARHFTSTSPLRLACGLIKSYWFVVVTRRHLPAPASHDRRDGHRPKEGSAARGGGPGVCTESVSQVASEYGVTIDTTRYRYNSSPVVASPVCTAAGATSRREGRFVPRPRLQQPAMRGRHRDEKRRSARPEARHTKRFGAKPCRK